MLQECILNRLKSLNWCEGKSEPKNTNKTVSDKETVKESKIKLAEKEQETTIKGIQHQPMQLDPTIKMMQDLTKD